MSRWTPRDPAMVTAPRDWLAMDPADFDTSAGPGALFDLTPSQVRPDPTTGTADLLALLADPATSDDDAQEAARRLSPPCQTHSRAGTRSA